MRVCMVILRGRRNRSIEDSLNDGDMPVRVAFGKPFELEKSGWTGVFTNMRQRMRHPKGPLLDIL